jgi:tRNA(Ile)-lysidine synthase
LAAAREKPSLEQRVLRFIEQRHLITPHQPLVVAVSGGPDSVCLLHILAGIKEELGISLHVAHLNHQLRGVEAEADAGYVAELARRLGIPATIEQRDVAAYQARQRLSLEEAAREVRYTFLAEVAGRIGAGRVAVGHTVDDHIETVLMHLIRGTGTRGLRGLQPVTEWRSVSNGATIIRPLLLVNHEETASYCARHQLEPRADASNLSLSPLRNKVRLQLLPLLRSYNPRIAEALLRTASIAGDDIAFLDRQVTRVWDEIARKQENMVTLDRERFLKLPSALQRHLLRATIERLVGNVMDIEARHIDGIMEALTKPAGRRLDLPLGLTFCIDYDRFLIGGAPAVPFPVLDTELPVNVPGETRLPGWRVTAAIMLPEAMKDDAGGYKSYFDLDRTGDKLVVRGRQPGDRFQPLGMSQPKKLGEFMIDARIPRQGRGQVPLVCSPEHIIWVVGWRIDERVKVTKTTRQILCLEFERG